MNRHKLKLIAAIGLALSLVPTLSTVGVTGAEDLIASKTSVTQAIPLASEADRALMSAIDTQISQVLESQR
jgi:hypothetical protein